MSYLTNFREELENSDSLEFADAPQVGAISRRQTSPAMKRNVMGAPKFKAQFDITFSYLRVGAGNVANPIMPVPLFGANDYNSQYARAFDGISALYTAPPLVHIYPDMGGVGVPGLVATAGDIVIEFTKAVGSDYLVIHCTSVAMASLVSATASDKFVTNLIRYALPSPVALAQFNQPIEYRKQGLFGKSLFDTLNPNSYKSPEQNQANIIDIPVSFKIDKETTIKTYYDTSNYAVIGTQTQIFAMSIFVEADVRQTF